jgi:two-component system, OmpR family, phosphate regulon sensor histidine kinase PhoR
MKNPTPKNLALIVSLVVTLILGLSSYLIDFFQGNKIQWYFILITALFSFVASYLLFYYALEIFIYRKIKLIYKTIYNLKTSKEQALSKVDLKTDIISEVNQEVIEWAQDKKNEIDQLKRLEVYRREFLGNVSHELKTPIFNIQGYIHTLLDGGMEDEHINLLYLEKASKSVERLCTIVEDLESISRLEAGELLLEVRTFDIHELTKDVFDSFDIKAREKKISTGFKDGCDRPFYVYADKERIRQVIVNLVINAFKYGKPGGKTLVGFYDMDENILVEVTDDGIGIEENHLSRLFERFYRVDKSRSREQGGTGLGLAIVKHIIEAHHQTINVRSTFGIGSTFGFTLKKSKS